jgi:hypothetical protein
MHLDGMVAKRKDSAYAFKRSRWRLKVKTAAGRKTKQKRIDTWEMTGDEDDEILSTDIVFSTQEIIDEFYRQCEAAAEAHQTLSSEAARDLCRPLDRDYRLRSQQLSSLLNRNS